MFKILLLCLCLFTVLETKRVYEILDLQSTDSSFNTEANRWTPTNAISAPLYSTCSGTYLLGGYGKVSSGGNTFTRHYTGLEEHVSLTVTYDAWIIDATATNTGTLGFGGLLSALSTVTTYSLSTNVASLSTDLCGTGTFDLAPIQVTHTFLHTGEDLYLKIGGSGVFGFRNVKIMVASADLTANTNCAYTTPNTILDATYNCACSPGQVWIGSCQTCDDSCLTCFDQSATGCLLCNVGYYYDGGFCKPCSSSCATCFANGPSSCSSCPIGYVLNPDFTCRNLLIDKFVSIVKPTQNAASASMVVSSVASVGTSATARASMNGQMIQYIKYMGINYPSDLATALQTWNQDYLNFDIPIDQPSVFEKKDGEYNDIPEEFSVYDDDIDSTFFVNFWSDLLMLGIIAIFLVIFSCIEWIANRKIESKNVKKYSKMLRVIVQNLLVTYIYADAADIFVFSVLDFKTNNEWSKLNIINLVVSIIFIAILVALILMHFIILKRYHRLRRLLYDAKEKKEAFEEFQERHQGITVLWHDFKEKSIFTHSFLLIAVLRDIVFSLVLVLLYKYPLMQAIILVSLSAIVLSYLIVFRPFVELKEALQAYVCEIILLGVNICVLMLAISDKNGGISGDGRELIGKIVVIMCLVFNFVPVVFFVINVILLIKEVVEKSRERRKRHKVLPSSPLASPIQSVEPTPRKEEEEVIFERNDEENKSFTTSPPSMIQPQLNDSANTALNVRAALKNRIAKKLFQKGRTNSDVVPLNIDLDENNTSRGTFNKD